MTAGHVPDLRDPLDPRDRPGVYLTHEIPPVRGVIKARPEDFLVEEIPGVEPVGEGEHLYLFVEKRLMSTMDMIAVLARHFRVRRSAVGVAGLKDKHAITRQLVSVHLGGRSPDAIPALDHPRLGVLWADRHTQRLRRGQLRGNRFSIRIREVEIGAVRHARDALAALEASGVPNRFGSQRFGYRRRNHLIGAALLRGEFQDAVDLLLAPSDDPDIDARDNQLAARIAYRRGDLEEARSRLSRSLRSERKVLGALLGGASPREAFASLDARERSFFLSAFQSAVFNALLDDRLRRNTLGTLAPGDVAFEHGTRACTPVESDDQASALAARLASLEVSPSGPMWGPGLVLASGEVFDRERAALSPHGLTSQTLLEHRSEDDDMVLEGERRPFRVPLTNPDIEAGVDEFGSYIRCAFDLPRGAFATVVMEEIMKNDKAAEVAMRDQP